MIACRDPRREQPKGEKEESSLPTQQTLEVMLVATDTFAGQYEIKTEQKKPQKAEQKQQTEALTQKWLETFFDSSFSPQRQQRFTALPSLK